MVAYLIFDVGAHRVWLSPGSYASLAVLSPAMLGYDLIARQTMNEYRTGASQTLEAVQLIRREKRVKLNTEVFQSSTRTYAIFAAAPAPPPPPISCASLAIAV